MNFGDAFFANDGENDDVESNLQVLIQDLPPLQGEIYHLI